MRTVTAAVQAALTATNVPMLVLAEMNFGSGMLRATNAPYAFSWGGNSYLGLGALGGIDVIKESASVEANGLGLRLSGVPLDGEGQSELIAIALGEHYQGRSIILRVALLSDQYQILDSPVVVFSGRMDTMSIETGKTATIVLTAESRLADLERPRVRRYNSPDQVAEYPGDLGLQYVEQMVSKQIRWGRG